MNKRRVGMQKEQEAVCLLQSEGYEILETNYRNRQGEIDIIAREGEYLCFVEVKYRADLRCGTPQEAVHAQKQEKIIQVARYYMMKHGLNEWTPCRFDVVAITGEDAVLFRNAFEIR